MSSKQADYKKKKELEEARKKGEIPLEQDTETGALINPHNPEYISKRPWYLGDSGPSLKHQTIQNKKEVLTISEADQLYQTLRSQQQKKKKTSSLKFRKGSCRNCGASTHQSADCVERPRKRGAWKTNRDLCTDEVVVDLKSEKYGKLAFDAKRDEWLGYDVKSHQDRVEKRFQQMDEHRKAYQQKKVVNEMEEQQQQQQQQQSSLVSPKQLKKNKSKSKSKTNLDSDPDSDSDSDSDADDSDAEEALEFKDKEGGRVIAERIAPQGGLGGAQMKVTVRNLRIREDTAKYLRNLNPNSAYYDPKTRSMRDNPNPELSVDESSYAGDNMIRSSGDAIKLAQTQVFAWEANKHNKANADGIGEINPMATPSQAEFMRKNYEEKKLKLKQTRKQQMEDKYGGQKYSENIPSKELLLGQTEVMTQYTRDGRKVDDPQGKKGVKKSKYIEDEWYQNHTSVWGSYYDKSDHKWGYHCCFSKIRKSYCTGEAGKKAIQEQLQRVLVVPDNSSSKSVKEENIGEDSKQSMKSAMLELYGENLAPTLDPSKLKAELKKSKNNKKRKTEEIESDDRKRKYNSSSGNYEVSQEEMEAYKLSKQKGEDPMANISSEELLPL